MTVISISLANDLLHRLDELVEDKGYSSRSEAIRDSVREILSEYELDKTEQGRATATITVISGYERHDVDERLTRLRHENNELVTSNMHLHIGEEYCLEIFVVQGESSKILGFIGRVRAIRGVQQVKYTIVPILAKSE